MLFVIGLAFLLRCLQLAELPPGLTSDELDNALDAQRALSSGQFEWFYPVPFGGREGLFINLVSLSFWLVGPSASSLRMVSALAGTATVVSTYFLARELFWGAASSRTLALFAAYLTATSCWGITFSRLAYRGMLLPFVLTLGSFFLLRGVRTSSRRCYAISGALFGLGLHTYIPIRIMPLVLLVYLGSLAWTRPGFLRRSWRSLSLFLAAALLVAAPMILTFASRPDYFWSRIASTSVFSQGITNSHALLKIASNLAMGLAKYNLIGDPRWTAGVVTAPLLEPLVGVTFVAGFLIVAARLATSIAWAIRSGAPKSADETRHLATDALLLAWFFCLLAPEVLTDDALPHALRSLGTLPVVYLLATVPLARILERSRRWDEGRRRLLLPAILIFCAWTALFNSVKYYVVWTSRPEVAAAFSKRFEQLGEPSLTAH